MNRILISALAAATLASSAALAQGQQTSPTRAGGIAATPTPGQIVPEQRAYLRGYVVRQGGAPVALGERVTPGFAVPAGIELRTFPDTVFVEVPAARPYRYFSTGDAVVLVDPDTRRVIEVIE